MRLSLLAGSLAAAGCAATGAPLAIPPDAAAIAAAERARGAFEALHPLVDDPELAARVSEIGRRAFLDTPEIATGHPVAPLAEGWRFAVLDRSEPEAFLFADRTMFVSRGALAALPGEFALESLFRGAASAFGGGGFRSAAAGGLVEQPLRLVLPASDPPLEDPVAERPARDSWLDLLDGLLFGEPVEFGVADGRRLLLPIADLRLALTSGTLFEEENRGVFRATRSGEPTGLKVREFPLSGGSFPAPDTGEPASRRALLRALGVRLREIAERRGDESSFVEVFRVRGFTGVRGRLGIPDKPDGLIALFRAPGSLVEVSLDCSRRRFESCEDSFLEVLESADRLWDTPIPGPLRIAVAAVTGTGSVRDGLRRLAAGGSVDGPWDAVVFLNRAWLDEELGPGDRVLILSRDRRSAAAAPEARGRIR